MSFSSQTKDELVESCKLESTEEKRSLLCGITHAAGSMTLGRGGIGLQYITENSSVAAAYGTPRPGALPRHRRNLHK